MTNCPNWFKAMVSFNWTIRSIRGTFGVSTAIAKHIQSTATTCIDAMSIRNASIELTTQIGF